MLRLAITKSSTLSNQMTVEKITFLLSFVFILFFTTNSNAQLTLDTTIPASNSIVNAAGANIVLTFSENMSQNSIDAGTGSVLDDNIQIISTSNGIVEGIWTGDGTTTLTFDPTFDFDAGEVIYVTLTTAVQSSSAVFLANVETFQFSVSVTSGPATPDFFYEHVVSTATDGAQSVHVGDLDGDGDLDILSASERDDKIAWYENDGAADPSFTAHVVSTAADGAYHVLVGDVDGDGDLDILSASQNNDKVAWYENDGAAAPSFAERVVSTDADGVQGIHVGDLDGDGDLDILSATDLGDEIAWYENDGATDPSFTAHVVSTTAVGANSVHVGDVDGDGDLDILSASRYSDKIAWYENDGATDPSFTEQVVSTDANVASSVYVGDVDGDGDLDILSASRGGSKIAWYENDGAADPSFTEQVVSTGASNAYSVHVGDVDGDGDLDILSASRGDHKIAWYENDGAADPSFTTHVVSTSASGPLHVHVGDVDGDGDLDILSASYEGDKITWYENTYTVPATQATSISFPNFGTTQMDVSWTNGNGSNRIVVVHEGAAVDTDPAYQVTYTANATFGSGDQLGTGNYVVYNGTGSSVTMTGLTYGNTYHVRVYEYNGIAGDETYNINTDTGNPSSQLFTFSVDPISNISLDENTIYTSVTPNLSGATPVGTLTYSLGGTDAGDFTINSSTGVVSMIARDFEAPEDADTDNVYEVTIIAIDDDSNSASEDWTVTIEDVVESATFTIDAIANANVDENTAYSSVTPSITGTPIGTLTYSLGGTDASDFTINSITGVVSMVARDFESPEDADTDNAYEVTITATDDDNNFVSEDWTVTVTDVIETAFFSINTITDVSIVENNTYTSVTPSITGTPIATLTYSLGGTDASDFTINSITGVVSMVARDFESPEDANTDNVYEVAIIATDGDSNSASEGWTVTIDDVVESATFTIDAIANANVDENTAYISVTPSISGATPIGTLTYSLGGIDASDFTINSATGVVSMVARDFESPEDADTNNAYEVTITATDDDSNSASEGWTVTIDDVIETATFTIDAIADANVDENTAYTSVTPSITGTPIGTLTYSLGGTDADDFTINSITGIVSMVARDFDSPEDADTDNVYEVTITATDDDSNTASEDWTVTINEIISEADLALSSSFSPSENLQMGDIVTVNHILNNNGPGDATLVELSINLPAGLDYISNNCNAQNNGTSLTWAVGNLTNGSTTSCSITIEISGYGQQLYQVTVTGSEDDLNQTNNSNQFYINAQIQAIPVLNVYGMILFMILILMIGFNRRQLFNRI